MKFKSIRNKLISRVSVILILSFVGVLSVLSFVNYHISEKNLKQTEENIRAALIAKGRTLVRNNGQALKGMVEDYAFSAIQNLVSSTVQDDEDIVYGIYMDTDRQPWVQADHNNPEGAVVDQTTLQDSISLWASKLTKQDYRLADFNNEEVYEFAAPVMIDDEVFGYIRYAISTQKMQNALKHASAIHQEKLMEIICIVLAVGALAFLSGFIATRKMARHITTPLGTLTSAASAITEGDYASPVAVTSNDEIGLLANNFDSMRLTIQKKMNDLSELNVIGEILASLRNQNKALAIVLKTISRHCGMNQGSVCLFNADRELEVKARYPLSEQSEQTLIDFSADNGILSKAIEQKTITHIYDIKAHDSTVIDNTPHTHPTDSAFDNILHPLMCIPLLDKDTLLGVITLSDATQSIAFEENDYEFMTSITRLLVITIKNIRMREIIEEHNHTLEQKVEERTAALQEKTNDILSMMQNMHQGLFTIMENGLIHHEYAVYLKTIFETDDIANRCFMDLLFSNTNLGSNTLNQIETTVKSLLGEDEMMFEVNAHMLITEYTCFFGHSRETQEREKIVQLDWNPIIQNGVIDKIMVIVRDVTELKFLQIAAEEQKRELEIIGQILSIEPSKFEHFLTTSHDFIDRCSRLIRTTSQKDLNVISELFRNMHTLKGNARTYGFTYITDSIHDIESTYDALRKDKHVCWNGNQLLDDLEKAEQDIKHYEMIARDKLRHTVDTVSKGVNIDSASVQQLLNAYASINPKTLPERVQNWLDQAYQLAATLDAIDLTLVLGGVIRSMSSVARQLKKPAPSIVIPEQKILVRSEAVSLLENVFMHLFRNAIDHGIENAEERRKKGKPEHGTIQLSVTREPHHLMLAVQDDGRGLSLKKLREKGIENGILDDQQSDPTVIANLIFASGFSTSTHISGISGRGVGMDAVKHFLLEQDADIQIVLNENASIDNDYCAFSIHIRLPNKLCITPPMPQSPQRMENKYLQSPDSSVLAKSVHDIRSIACKQKIEKNG
ncbi:MAG: HAMP domain-containing protein [Gammaproteobacteria bacterium]